MRQQYHLSKIIGDTLQLYIEAQSRLTQSQHYTIAFDCDMPDAQIAIPVRLALLYYSEKRLRLDVDSKKDKPAEKPVIVANRKEIVKAREAALA